MSLITLTSSFNSENPRSTDSAIIKNNFKDGVLIRKGSEISLVNMTINKQSQFVVSGGAQMVWRIGDRNNFVQHTAAIPAGTYTGFALASNLQEALNVSTVIGVYKGNWTVVFSQTAQEGKGSFTINYGTGAVPPVSGQVFQNYSGAQTIQNTATESTIETPTNGLAFTTGAPTNIVTAPNGIWGNGGEIISIVKPFPISSVADWDTALVATGGITGDWTNQINGELADFVKLTPAQNGYSFEVNYVNGIDPPDYIAFRGTIGKGLFWISTDVGTAPGGATSEALYYSEVSGALQSAAAGGIGAYNGTGTSWQYTVGSLNPNESAGHTAKSQVGFVRNQLYEGRNDYPGNANAEINGDVGGYDLWLQCRTNNTSGELNFSLAQMRQTQGTTFPAANWRTSSAYVFQNLKPSTLANRTDASNWTTYKSTDSVKMTIVVRGLIELRVLVAHDDAGNGVWTEEQTLATSQTQGFVSRIKEAHYPLRPVSAQLGGGFYPGEENVNVLNGIFDDEEHKPQVTGDMGEEPPPTTEPIGADPVVLQKSALFKMDLIPQEQIGPPIPPNINQLDVNGAQGNIGNLIGTSNYYVFPVGNETNPIISLSDPFVEIAEPSLSVEMFDFNIKGYNGKTGDTAKVIAIVPKEELQTGDRQGTLHYYPPFPVFIDLNVPEDKVYYDLNVVLRTPDGRIATDLLPPTEITLLIRESEETKQRKMMIEQSEIIASAMANRNATKINQIGVNNPKINWTT